MKPIYISHLDNDCYKFSMGAFFWHYHRGTLTEYAYRCRDPQINLSFIYDDLCEQIQLMSKIKLEKDEQKWLFENTRVTQDYLVNFLSKFSFDPNQVTIEKINENPGLKIRINGPIEEASLWEMPLMYTISELYFRKYYENQFDEVVEKAIYDLHGHIDAALKSLKNLIRFFFSEFGCRRRLAQIMQDRVIQILIQRLGCYLVGTSNVYFARKYNLKAVGTQAHEAMMLYQALVHPDDSQRKFLREWIDFYRGWLGIALTDTLGSKKWDKDFTKDLMIDYLGQRHDSGDPFVWAKERIAAYEREGIDPKEKTLLFSDNLNFEKAITLSKEFGDSINVTHGIGTFLTNSIPSMPTHKALNQVIKLVWANGRPVAKIPDDPLKHQCEDRVFLEYMKHISK